MNVSCFAVLCFFLSQALCASGALTQEEKEEKIGEIRAHGQYSYEALKELVFPHLDPSLHQKFEEGFRPLYAHDKHRNPHSVENGHIACFFESTAGCSLDVQKFTLASRLLVPAHMAFLTEDTISWAKNILYPS